MIEKIELTVYTVDGKQYVKEISKKQDGKVYNNIKEIYKVIKEKMLSEKFLPLNTGDYIVVDKIVRFKIVDVTNSAKSDDDNQEIDGEILSPDFLVPKE